MCSVHYNRVVVQVQDTEADKNLPFDICQVGRAESELRSLVVSQMEIGIAS